MAKLYAGILPFQARLSMVYNDGMMEWVHRRLTGKYPRKQHVTVSSIGSTESLAGAFDPLEHSVCSLREGRDSLLTQASPWDIASRSDIVFNVTTLRFATPPSATLHLGSYRFDL